MSPTPESDPAPSSQPLERVGALIAVGIAYILRGPGGRDPSGETAGSGRLMAPERAEH